MTGRWGTTLAGGLAMENAGEMGGANHHCEKMLKTNNKVNGFGPRFLWHLVL
jgi:hypothetical protein